MVTPQPIHPPVKSSRELHKGLYVSALTIRSIESSDSKRDGIVERMEGGWGGNDETIKLLEGS